MARLSDMLERIDRLPALPATLLRLIPLLSSESATTEQLLSLVQKDEALSMAVLRLANSAAFGAPGRTFSLKESVVRLGRRRLKALVMEQQTAPMFARAGTAFGLQRGALWRGALAGAFAAEDMAQEHAPAEAELAFLCGLLRDVGKIVLDLHYGNTYLDVVHATMTRGEAASSFVEAERRAIGFDHAELGAALAERWRLPERVSRAIRAHHEPPAGEGRDVLADVVHAGDVLCLWAGLAVGGDGLCYRLADHVRLAFSLDRAQAESRIASMCDRLTHAENELGMLAPQGAAA
jgi:putative nucleotidyltransferase with HDIG domain